MDLAEGYGPTGGGEGGKRNETPPEERGTGVGREESLILIEWDIPRTFPTLSFFHDGECRRVYVPLSR